MPRPLLIALLAFAAWPAFAQQPGDILWSTPLEEDPTELMSRPEIGPDGAIHMFVNDIFVIEPDGSVRLRIDANTLYTSDIAVAPDGRIFVAESIFNPGVGVDYYVVGYSPTGEELWRTPFEATEAVSYGPSLGPDGNLYGVVGFGYTTAGAFSVSTDGTFRWSVPGFERESTSWPKEIPFASDRFYAVDESVPCQLFSNGIAAFSFSGEMLWCLPWNVEHPPVVGPDDSVYGLGYNSLTKFSPDGDLLWRYNFPSPVGLLRDPAIGPDGTVYVQESRSLWAFHPDGSVRYEVQIVDSGFPVQPTVSPDGSRLLTQASVEGTQYLIALNAADGSERWRVAIPYITDPPYTFTSDGDVVYVPLRAGGLAPVELMAVYVGDGSAPVTVSAEPVGGPITIPPSGGAFAFAVTLTNTTDQPQGVEAWSAVSGPAGREPVLGPRAVALAPGQSLTRTLTQAVPAAAPAGTYTYTVNVGAFGGATTASDSFVFTKASGAVRGAASEAEWTATGWDEAPAAQVDASLPGGFALSAVSPNPSRGTARLVLELAETQAVTAAVYNALGRRVAILHAETLEPGAHALALDDRTLPAGVYIVRVTGETFAATRRLTVAH